jgi:KaiC/GvpD/RAD55 family RecA-like ATPase
MFAPCLEGGRNEQAFTIAHRLFKKGVFKQDVEGILGLWNRTNPKPLSPSEISKVVYSAEKGRVELAPGNLDKAFNSIGSLLDAIPEEVRSGKKKFRTGYEFFDSYTLGGFEAEELVFIAARSGNFKTAFLCNILQRGSAIAQKPCLLFSMEMGSKTLRPRLIQQAEGISKTEVLDRMAHGDTFGNTREAFQHLDIVHLSNLTTEQMTDLIESYIKKKGSVAAIGIDFLGLFKGCNNDTQKTARQAQELKTVIAKSFDCPVICLAQAKQVYEGREGNVELTRNCVKDSDSVLDLGDYSIGMWKHWVTFADATEDNFLFGRFLKSRGLDSEKFKPNPYFALKWKKEVMHLEDIIYCEKAPFRFRQVKEQE